MISPTVASAVPAVNPNKRKPQVYVCSFCKKVFADLLHVDGRGWIRHVWKFCPRCKQPLTAEVER